MGNSQLNKTLMVILALIIVISLFVTVVNAKQKDQKQENLNEDQKLKLLKDWAENSFGKPNSDKLEFEELIKPQNSRQDEKNSR